MPQSVAGSQPLVTIVVPTFRMARFLPAMLDSALTQDYRPLEIIVVDGKSDDGTVAILEAHAARHAGLRWLSEPDQGPADAVNKGLALAQGEFVWIQNADDVFLPGAVARAVAALVAHPEASFAYGDVESIDRDGTRLQVRKFPEFSWAAFFAWSCTLAQSSILIRTRLARELGGWNAQYYSCDLDFWLRLALRAPPVHVPAPLSAWRRHAEQRTRPEQYHRIWDGYWRMIRDNAQLRASPLRLRRWARASCHLLALRFHPPGHLWAVRAHALCGLALHPTAWRYQPRWRFLRLIPGIVRLRRLLLSPEPDR